MKLADIIINKTAHKDGTFSYPNRALQIEPISFKEMYTMENGTDRFNKGKIVDRCANMWFDHLGGNMDVTVSGLYIDRKTLYNVDTKERVISGISDTELGDMDIDKIAVSRAIAKIAVPGLAKGISPAIAININERGDEFAWGNNVHICSNLTIMRADNIISTYKKKKDANGKYIRLNTEDILKLFERFMKRTKEKFEEELNQISRWKQQYVSRPDFHRFLGVQFSKIQVVNHYQVARRIKELQDKHLPINGQQLGRIAVEAFKPSYPEYKWDGERTSIWNIINYGTEQLKFQNGSDSATILRANSNWVKLVNEFAFQNN